MGGEFQVVFHGPVDGFFGVLGFFEAFIADFGQPLFEGFGLGGGGGLDKAEQLFGVGDVGQIRFTICRLHFELSQKLGQVTAFLLQFGFQCIPIFPGAGAFC